MLTSDKLFAFTLASYLVTDEGITRGRIGRTRAEEEGLQSAFRMTLALATLACWLCQRITVVSWHTILALGTIGIEATLETLTGYWVTISGHCFIQIAVTVALDTRTQFAIQMA